jgi:hypothetical protein
VALKQNSDEQERTMIAAVERRLAQRVVFARDLLATLQRRELQEAAAKLRLTQDLVISHQLRAIM